MRMQKLVLGRHSFSKNVWYRQNAIYSKLFTKIEMKHGNIIVECHTCISQCCHNYPRMCDDAP